MCRVLCEAPRRRGVVGEATHLGGPLGLAHIGRQVVVPALATLLARAPIHQGADRGPAHLVAAVQRRCDQRVELLVLGRLPDVLLPHTAACCRRGRAPVLRPRAAAQQVAGGRRQAPAQGVDRHGAWRDRAAVVALDQGLIAHVNLKARYAGDRHPSFSRARRGRTRLRQRRRRPSAHPLAETRPASNAAQEPRAETAVCETSPMPSSCLQVRSSPSRSSTIHAHCQDGYILAMMHSRSRSDTAPATFLSQARPVCAYGGGASMCSAMRRSTMSSSLSTVSIAVSMAATSPSPLLTASHASCSVSELFFSWSLHT